MERVECGRDRRRRSTLTGNRFERLQAVAGDVDDDTFVGPDDTIGRELLQCRDRYSAGRLREDALGSRQQPHAVDDLVVGDRSETTAGGANDVEREVAVGRIADRK